MLAERILVDSLMVIDFTQINCVPNCHGKFLDLVFLSDDFRFSVLCVESPMISMDSHHKAICILLDRYEFLPDLKLGSSPSNEFNFGRADYASLNDYISGINWFEIWDGLNLKDMHSQLIYYLNVGLCAHVPKKVLIKEASLFGQLTKLPRQGKI